MPALLVGAPTGGLVGVDADLDAMAAMAPALGLGAPIVERSATVAIVRRRLAELLARTAAGDRVLLYLTGHGGVVENLDHDLRAARPAPQRLHYFVATPDPSEREQVLFDVELSLWSARLAERTTNVVVIVDACFSSGLVRDGVTDGLIADFKAWRETHQDEIDALHVEAHPDVVRLAAAGVTGVARPTPNGSALTRALLAALAEPGARRSSWLALFAQIELRLIRAGVAQQARLSGPVRRRIFDLETTIPPGAFPVRADPPTIALEGGAQQGVAPGDLFLVIAAGGEHLFLADRVDPTTTTLRRTGPLDEPLVLSPGSFALPLRLRGHGGVVVTGTEATKQAVERALKAAHWELWSPQREAQALATVHCSDTAISLRTPGGLAAEVTTPSQCPEILRRFARATRLQTLGGLPLTALGLRVVWGRVRHGACEPLSGPAVELGAADPLYVRVENSSEARRFVSVFWLADDGDGVQLSRSESMGVEVTARSTYLLGDRPFARVPRGVLPPRRPLAPGERRHERLVIVATQQRQALWSFDSGRTGSDGRRTGELAGTEVLRFTVTSEPEP